GPIGSVRIGKIGDSFVINPRFSDLEKSSMDIIATGTEDSIIMIEGEAKEITEEDLIEALKLGHETIKLIVNIQKKVVEECGKPKIEPEVKEVEEELVKEVKEISFERIKKINRIPEKVKREGEIEALKEEVLSILEEKFPEKEQEIEAVLNDLFKKNLRSMIIGESVRIDRRRIEDIRPISCEVGILPRAHGSALFTRGETQSLAATTLGTKIDEQIIDGVDGEFSKSYMLHYNFPPFSVGEVRPIRGPGRREIGHGYLAERSLKAVIPDETVFPYTVRIVSDILESNGSSSMATVCAGSLSLMDAGVPVKRTVAGIAMGLIKENDKHIILTDIIGAEDYYGDMDFKIAGTREGVTAFQLDLKIPGISFDIIEKALRQAREGRMKIIDIMEQVIEKPRSELSTYAPRILTMKIPIELIGDVIGPGGKRIRNIIEETGSKIEIEDDGTILISSIGEEAGKKAREMIEKYIERPEVGSIYLGKVKKVTNFGAFVEILPGKEGLLHISEIQHQRVNKVEDILKPGDKIEVKIIKIDSSGKISLSRKALIEKPRGYRDYGYQPYIRKKIQRK
ncbi:MAG: polyribonucleotide nucleotidyltransferase, partial [Fidelibacterota bacterium]